MPLKALLCIFFFFTDSQSLRCLNVDVADSVAKQAGVRLMEHLRANRIFELMDLPTLTQPAFDAAAGSKTHLESKVG